MKRFISIFAVAASIVAACATTSCQKESTDPTSTNPLIGEWVNEVPQGTTPRKVVYKFEESSVSCLYYYNGSTSPSGGNGGTYTYSAPSVTISFTTPAKTETGTLSGSELTINTSDFGQLTFIKK